MTADLFDRFSGPQPVGVSVATEPAFAARPRLLALRAALSAAAARVAPGRWNEPTVFFFDSRRQAELDRARGPVPDRFEALAAQIGTELLELFAHVEVRRVARAIDGLRAAARTLAPHCPAAGDLADLLAVPDDEVFLVLAPAERTGVRLHVRGAATVGQFCDLFAPTQSEPFQLFAPGALGADGTLPTGLAGCGQWFWPEQPLAAIPRINGERIVLVGPAVIRHAEPAPRFPGLRAEAEVVQTLNPFQVADALSRLAGRPVPAPAPADVPSVARAA